MADAASIPRFRSRAGQLGDEALYVSLGAGLTFFLFISTAQSTKPTAHISKRIFSPWTTKLIFWSTFSRFTFYSVFQSIFRTTTKTKVFTFI